MRIETIVGLIVVIALIFGLGTYTLNNIQETQSTNTEAYNVTGQGIEAFGTFADLMTPIVMIFIATLMIWGISLLVKKSSGYL